MNTLDKKYTDLLQDILDNGVIKGDRTGTGTISVFGREIRHNMSEGFPLLTTKKMPWKVMVTELIWFLRGDTNIKYLVNNGCNIWNGDAHKKYISDEDVPIKWLFNKAGKEECVDDDFYRHYTMKEFIEKIKTDDGFAKEWGELGPIYGAQWRGWKGPKTIMKKTGELYPSGEFKYDYIKEPFDQIATLVHNLKNNPDSRRLMVNAWNVPEIPKMTLPPCHYGFQCYTRELTNKERYDILEKTDMFNKRTINIGDANVLDVNNIPKRALSLQWNQRSVDTFLGLPFNIASYGLLLIILAKECNMIPDELIGSLGDTHLYSNHVEQAKTQMGWEFNDEEFAVMLKAEYPEKYQTYKDLKFEKSKLVDEQRYEDAAIVKDKEKMLLGELVELVAFKMKKPFKLPTVEIANDVKWKEGDCLPYYSPNDFKLVGYESHPAIKAPLSN